MEKQDKKTLQLSWHVLSEIFFFSIFHKSFSRSIKKKDKKTRKVFCPKIDTEIMKMFLSGKYDLRIKKCFQNIIFSCPINFHYDFEANLFPSKPINFIYTQCISQIIITLFFVRKLIERIFGSFRNNLKTFQFWHVDWRKIKERWFLERFLTIFLIPIL